MILHALKQKLVYIKLLCMHTIFYFIYLLSFSQLTSTNINEYQESAMRDKFLIYTTDYYWKIIKKNLRIQLLITSTLCLNIQHYISNLYNVYHKHSHLYIMFQRAQ